MKNTRVIVVTVIAGGVTGFTFSWFAVGAALVAPPVLILSIVTRSFV